jgi:hypothetical protein
MAILASPGRQSMADPFLNMASPVDLEAESFAFQLGFRLGREGTPASPLTRSERVRASFHLGVETGRRADADRIQRP